MVVFLVAGTYNTTMGFVGYDNVCCDNLKKKKYCQLETVLFALSIKKLEIYPSMFLETREITHAVVASYILRFQSM